MKILYILVILLLLSSCSQKKIKPIENNSFESYLVKKINEVKYARDEPKLQEKVHDGISRDDIFYNQTRRGFL